MLRINLIAVACLLASLIFSTTVYSQQDTAPWPTDDWSSSTPEAQGIDSQTLVEMLQFLQDEGSNFDSMLFVRNGYLVLEVYQPPYDENEDHSMWSATKTIISVLVGIAVDQGMIQGAEQPIVDLFPDLTFENMDDDKVAITVGDLLSMRGGLNWSGINIQQILDNPVAEPAGTVFQYKRAQPRLFSSTIEYLTGGDTLDYAREVLFDPLGISVDDNDWDIVGAGTRDGATGLSLTPREMAKIGYLFLNEGTWDGQQIVSAEWVAESTAALVDDISGGGNPDTPVPTDSYGYYWWVSAENGYYGALGIGSQTIVVFPEKNAVLVTTSNPNRPNSSLNDAVEAYIIPLMVSDEPLPENPDAVAELNTLIEAFASEDE